MLKSNKSINLRFHCAREGKLVRSHLGQIERKRNDISNGKKKRKNAFFCCCLLLVRIIKYLAEMNVNNEQFPDIANLIRFYLCAPGIAPV